MCSATYGQAYEHSSSGRKKQVPKPWLQLHKEISLLLQLPWEYMGEGGCSAEDAVSALYKYLQNCSNSSLVADEFVC